MRIRFYLFSYNIFIKNNLRINNNSPVFINSKRVNVNFFDFGKIRYKISKFKQQEYMENFDDKNNALLDDGADAFFKLGRKTINRLLKSFP